MSVHVPIISESYSENSTKICSFSTKIHTKYVSVFFVAALNGELCSHPFSVFQFSQGSVLPLIRWCGWYWYLHICHLFL